MQRAGDSYISRQHVSGAADRSRPGGAASGCRRRRLFCVAQLCGHILAVQLKCNSATANICVALMRSTAARTDHHLGERSEGDGRDGIGLGVDLKIETGRCPNSTLCERDASMW